MIEKYITDQESPARPLTLPKQACYRRGARSLATDSIQIRVTFITLFISNSLQIITIIFKCVLPVNYCNFSVSIFIILKSLALQNRIIF